MAISKKRSEVEQYGMQGVGSLWCDISSNLMGGRFAGEISSLFWWTSRICNQHRQKLCAPGQKFCVDIFGFVFNVIFDSSDAKLESVIAKFSTALFLVITEII